jgi:cardiolipin synthase
MSSGRRRKSSAPFSIHNRVELIRGGREYFERLIQLIENACESVHLQTYIFSDDETGNEVGEALIRAVRRNVKVNMVVDGYASQSLSSGFVAKLKSSGIQFRFFEPILRTRYYYFGRRLHHKLAVFDSRLALVGGINISNNYNQFPGERAWFDFAFFVEGEVARELCILCWKTWFGFSPGMKLTPCEEKQAHFDIDPTESSAVRMRRNDWVRGKKEITKTYLEIFRQAKSQIIIVSSYFLPGEEFKQKMRSAVRRGVRIKLVLTRSSDVYIAKQAERHMYRWLMKNKMEIYEYKPTVLHGKLAICDDEWMTLGSYNVNNISAFASIELNLDVKNEVFVNGVREMLEGIIMADCERVTEADFAAHNGFFSRIWQEACFICVRAIFFLFTFYFTQKE